MKLATTLLPRADQMVSDRIDAGDLAVVIDVLRATSVMATALQAGAAQVITAREVAQARTLAEQLSSRPLLCGERGCRPISGFDLGNSPGEYTPDRVRGKTLVLTTTNGTRAIEFAEQASEVITASFLNFTAAVDRLAGSRSVHLVCAGTEGELTAEDALLAGAMIDACETRYGVHIQDDDSLLARQLWRGWFGGGDGLDNQRLALRLRETRGGRNLVRVGYEEDLSRCAAVDSVNIVPRRVGRSPIAFAAPAN